MPRGDIPRCRLALLAATVTVVASGCSPATPHGVGGTTRASPESSSTSAAGPGLPRPANDAFAATVTTACPDDVDIETALAGTITAVDDTGPAPWITVDADRWFTDDLGTTIGLWAPGWDGRVGQDWLLAATRYQSGTMPSGDVIPCHSEPRTDESFVTWEQRWDGSVPAGADTPEQPADPQVLARLDQAQERWQATAPASWTATITRTSGNELASDCGDGPIRVVVDDGTVLQAVDLRSDCDLLPADAPTINELFAQAREVAGALDGTIEFDDTYGFIRSMYAHDRAVEVSLGVTDFLPRALLLADDEPQMLADARARWEAAGFDDYRMVIEIQCFCAFTGPVAVDVRDGQPTNITPTDDARGDAAHLGSELTVTAIFDSIAAAQSEGDVDVAFDPDLGYPIFAALDPMLNAIDDETTYRILELAPIS